MQVPPSGPATAPVRVLIVAPAPLGEGRIGGIANFIRGFVQHMPDDFAAEIVGIGVGDEDGDIGHWRDISLAGRQVRFMPVARIGQARRSGRTPAKARIVAGMLRHRRRIATAGRVAQVHAPAMELGLIGRGVPTVRVVHNAPADLAGATGESSWRRFGRGLHLAERLTFGRADAVFFVNQAAHAEYRERLPGAAARMAYLANGIDTTLFRPLSGAERDAARAEFAARLGIPTASRWLVFAGRLDQQKDPLLLLRAFAEHQARPAAPSAELLVAGEGRLRADAERLAAELLIADRVRFLGLWPREELAQLLPAADAFVLSSAFEAAPFAVLEALAAGLPVAATAVGDVPSQVQSGTTGMLAKERTPAALADAIAWTIDQDRDGVARAAAASIAPFELSRTLAPFYDEHRRLARRAGDRRRR